MKNQTTHNSSTTRGFTIIELMIATTILAVILLVVTAMAVNIGNLFYKDVNQASIQDNVRAITDELTQHLQLMGTTGLQQTPPTATTAGAICIDSTRYSYVIGKQISPNPANPPGDQTVHVLWRDTWTGGGCPPVTNLTTAASPSSSGTELIAPNSRLTAFCVGSYTPSTNSCTPPAAGSTTFTVTVGGAYGDGDLLSTTTGTTAQCKGQVGDRFCATAYLSSTVDQRLVTSATPPGGGGSSCGGQPAGTPPNAGASANGPTPWGGWLLTYPDSNNYTNDYPLYVSNSSYLSYHGPLHDVYSSDGGNDTIFGFRAYICGPAPVGSNCEIDPVSIEAEDGSHGDSGSDVVGANIYSATIHADRSCYSDLLYQYHPGAFPPNSELYFVHSDTPGTLPTNSGIYDLKVNGSISNVGGAPIIIGNYCPSYCLNYITFDSGNTEPWIN